MYIVINKTKFTRSIVEGNFPDLSVQLNRGDRLIIISTHSNTVKVPYFVECNGIKEWEYEEFSFSPLAYKSL
jgi:hypothetical protein